MQRARMDLQQVVEHGRLHIEIVVALFARLTSFPQESWWLESTLLGYFTPVVEMIRDLLPDNLAERLVEEVVSQPQA